MKRRRVRVETAQDDHASGICRVGLIEGERVIKYLASLVECDSMFPVVRHGLLRVPFEVAGPDSRHKIAPYHGPPAPRCTRVSRRRPRSHRTARSLAGLIPEGSRCVPVRYSAALTSQEPAKSARTAMSYLLDTDTVSFALRGVGGVGDRLRDTDPTAVAVSVVTEALARVPRLKTEDWS